MGFLRRYRKRHRCLLSTRNHVDLQLADRVCPFVLPCVAGLEDRLVTGCRFAATGQASRRQPRIHSAPKRLGEGCVDVSNRLHRLGILIGDRHCEPFFKSHDDFDVRQRVCAEIGVQVRFRGDLIALNAEFFRQDFLHSRGFLLGEPGARGLFRFECFSVRIHVADVTPTKMGCYGDDRG